MTTQQDDVVRVASGSDVTVRVWQQALDAEGIECRVVGEDLNAGIGTAIGNSVELWVRREDAARAEAVILAAEVRKDEGSDAPDQGQGGVD